MKAGICICTDIQLSGSGQNHLGAFQLIDQLNPNVGIVGSNLYTKEGNRSLIDHTLSLQRQGEKVTEECHSEEEKKEWLKKYFGIEK